MRRFTKAQERAVVLANYIGGVGYYLWHISWIVVSMYVLLEASQYVIVGSGPIYQTPAMTSAAATAESISMSSIIASALVILLVAICVFVLPYYVGWLSRNIPAWLLAQTTWTTTLTHVLRVKQILCIVLVCVAVLLLFSPDKSGGENIAFIVSLGVTLLSSLFFVAQHAIAAHWDIPVHRVF